MYEKLKAKIVEAVPEVMDNYSNQFYRVVRFKHKDLYGEIDEEIMSGEIETPITPEDVLVAIDKQLYNDIFISADGMICYGEKIQEGRFEQRWQMGKPLSEQSPETMQFLLDILETK